jgi:signal peptidase I
MDMPAASAPRRHVGLALLLSLLCSGLGQIYAGRGRRGAILLALALVPAPALFLLSYVGPLLAVLEGLGGLVLFSLLLFAFSLVDAALCARRAAVPYVPRTYNNAWLYVALIVFASGWQIGGTVWVCERAFQAFKVPTQSMSPTITPGDRVVVNKRRAEHLRRGDVIVYLAPGQRNHNFIKRVIGLPGEEIRMAEGVVYVDGRPLALKKEDDGVYREDDGGRWWRVRWDGPLQEEVATWGPVTVPADHVYVLGDHRDLSRDSRSHGPVPLGDVVGVAEYVFGPGWGGTFDVIR